ncbi:transcriptional regulator [Thermanaerovibrio velox DSM 12556]|uniref:Transcriptional regulator n=1 Tax=Thermanaerovibrio velox DSM 12556 TaxID=926567 RepID=H0UPL7_9BACT|nr:FadR/GntR family transcriptional regulator [Thermanaerovibrio velox]EHM09564.1 transcriptional regulator [Thermanaerovibrio velox DSM 12556]
MPDRVRQTRIYEKVVEEIKGDISSGRLKPGDPLPPERSLMDQLGVSRSSLREAFRVLELMGLIESIPGKGRFVRRPRHSSKEGDPLRERGLPLEDEAILELMEARRVLDPAIAREAARRAMPSDLTKMRRVLSSTREGLDDLESRAKGDFDFHLALAEATRNFVFVNIVRMNFNLIMATHDRIYALLEDKEAFLNEHKTLYDAILDRDPDRAESAAREHIERIYKTLQEVLALKGVSP